MRITAPGAAASIISPMIEPPDTSVSPRATFTSASYWPAVLQNLAAARACRPLLLRISTSRFSSASSLMIVLNVSSAEVPGAARLAGLLGFLLFLREQGGSDVDVFAPGVLGLDDRAL